MSSNELVSYMLTRTYPFTYSYLAKSYFYQKYIAINENESREILENKPIRKPSIFRKIRLCPSSLTKKRFSGHIAEFLENPDPNILTTTKRGLESETQAMKLINKNILTIKFNIIINPNFPWISGSPDAIVKTDSQHFIPLEIKSPQNGRVMGLQKMLEASPILYKRKTRYRVKKHSDTYIQIQLYMAIIGSPFGYIVFYNFFENRIYRVIVDIDDICINHYMTKGHILYFNNVFEQLIKYNKEFERCINNSF